MAVAATGTLLAHLTNKTGNSGGKWKITIRSIGKHRHSPSSSCTSSSRTERLIERDREKEKMTRRKIDKSNRRGERGRGRERASGGNREKWRIWTEERDKEE